MKLKAPPGVGEPCVAGVAIVARDGFYEVEADVGALLIECFGFVELEAADRSRSAPAPEGSPRNPAPRRRAAAKKPSA
jgi:hypothetical protein